MTMPIYAHTMSAPHPETSPASNGARIVTPDGRSLPLQATSLTCELGGGIARSVLKQRFHNPSDSPLAVTYLVPLPSDGAVSGYSFELQGVTTRGVVAPRAQAREQFEQALMDGRSAALLEQTRSSVFSQDIGNIPAGQCIEIEVIIDHPLAWIGGGWEFRFPTVVAPRYQNAEQTNPRFEVPIRLAVGAQSTPGEAIQEPDIAPAHECRLSILDSVTAAPTSSSHAVECRTEALSGAAVQLVRIDAQHLDRDLVLRWGVARAEPGVRLETARPSSTSPRAAAQYGLLSIVPPLKPQQAVPRDLIVLIDTSGSMAGEPLAQSVRLVTALINSLDERDRLELIEFSWRPGRWQRRAVHATPKHKQQALSWLHKLKASGGTEMRSGIEAALSSLREGAQRQVILVSDGLIGFEQQILETLSQRMPQSCRLHCVGVGHGVNRSLTDPAARAGRGVEVIVTPGEDLEPACKRLLARVQQPQIVNLRVSGSALLTQPERPLDVYAGSPSLATLELKTQGGTLHIHGDTDSGSYSEQITVAGSQPGHGSGRVLSLFARERVSDCELGLAALAYDQVDQRAALDGEIEALGVDFQIATRLTSWIAVSDEQTVDPGAPTRRVEQPHELAADLSAEGIGLRQPLAEAQDFGGMNVNRTSRFRGRASAATMGAPPPPPPPSFAPAPAGFGGAVPPQGAPPPAAAPPSPGAPPARQTPPAPPAQPTPRHPTQRPLPGKQRGLLRRIADLLSPDARDAETAADESAPVGESAADATRTLATAEGAAAETLHGTVRITSTNQLVVEFEAQQQFDWELPSAVWVELGGGTLLRLVVEAAPSTRSASIAAGQRVRLVCTWGARTSQRPTRVWISHGLAPLDATTAQANARFVVALS